MKCTNIDIKSLLGTILISLLSGCASFHDDAAITTPVTQNKTLEFHGINLSVTCKENNEDSVVCNEKVNKNIILEKLSKNENVIFNKKTAMHKINVHVEILRENNIFLEALSIATIGLIPAKSTSKYRISVFLVDKNGHVLKSVAQVNSISTWMQTFLIFWAPFYRLTNKESELINNEIIHAISSI